MRSIEDIAAEIEKLPLNEVNRLADWLTEYRARLWDSQIAEDAKPGGRLRRLVDEAKSEPARRARSVNSRANDRFWKAYQRLSLDVRVLAIGLFVFSEAG